MTASSTEECAWHFKLPITYDFDGASGEFRKIIELPYLIEIQKNSYDLVPAERRGADRAPEHGSAGGFSSSVFPIKDFNETASLEFVSYSLGEPKYDVEECHQRGMTFAAPLKVTVQLVLWDVDQQTGARSIKNVKEQEVYFGEIPLMTTNGTFMINGTERVIVSQLAPLAGSFLRARQGKNPRQRQVALLGAGDSRTAALGSTSNSTRATLFTCASTGGVNSTPRCCCARSA